MKTTTTLALTCLLGIATANAAVTLTPTQDSDVYEMFGNPTGSNWDLGVSSSPSGPHSQKSLIQFNLTGINGNDIQSATLRLYVNSPVEGNGVFVAGDVSIYSQAAAWNAVTLNWSGFSQGALLGTLNVSNNLTWVEFDATAIAKAWANGTTANNGFLLQTANGSVSQSAAFASMETGFAPQLVITTGAAVPEPSAMVLAIAGVAGLTFRRRRN